MRLVKLRGGTKAYVGGETPVTAIRDVDLDIDEGGFIAISGASGSGKSTLMHVIGCLDSLTSGTLEFDGEDISSLPDDRLAHIRKHKIGFVFQAFNLLPRMNVLRNVELPLVYAGISKHERLERTEEVLRMVGLQDRMKHNPNQLSGGESQRAAIARALINDPKLILADEPTGNLDSETGVKILDVFADLNSRGRTVVIVTHEEHVAQMCGRRITLKDGRIDKDTG